MNTYQQKYEDKPFLIEEKKNQINQNFDLKENSMNNYKEEQEYKPFLINNKKIPNFYSNKNSISTYEKDKIIENSNKEKTQNYFQKNFSNSEEKKINKNYFQKNISNYKQNNSNTQENTLKKFYNKNIYSNNQEKTLIKNNKKNNNKKNNNKKNNNKKNYNKNIYSNYLEEDEDKPFLLQANLELNRENSSILKKENLCKLRKIENEYSFVNEVYENITIALNEQNNYICDIEENLGKICGNSEKAVRELKKAKYLASGKLSFNVKIFIVFVIVFC